LELSDGDGGLATEASIALPNVVGFDAQGNLYIADGSGRIRRVDPSGLITTVVGPPAGGGPTAPGEASQVEGEGKAVDAQGSLYVATEGGFQVVKVTPTGEVTTVAGTGEAGYSGDGGPATEAKLGFIYGPSAVDADGNLYIGDLDNDVVRRVDTNGIITTVAGTGKAGYSGDGGLATEAKLNDPTAVAVDSKGNIYVADGANARIRRIDRNGIITTVAGNGKNGLSGDGGPAPKARIAGEGVWVDAEGNLYIIGGAIRRVDTNGFISTIAGSEDFGYSGDGGLATEAQLGDAPTSVAIGPDGDLYIGDWGNNRIRKVALPLNSSAA
jgi:sugar lactone lactonase YvrE